MIAICEGGVEVGIECSCSGVGVALNARYLYQSAYGVAGHAEVMFKPHLGGVFYLRHRAAEELCGSRCRHSACHADLALAAHLCAGDRGVMLDHIADESGGSQRMQDTRLAEVLAFP